MIWAAIYVLGAGAYSGLALDWNLRMLGPPNGKADDVERWAAIGFTLIQAMLWPFFALVALVLAATR